LVQRNQLRFRRQTESWACKTICKKWRRVMQVIEFLISFNVNFYESSTRLTMGVQTFSAGNVFNLSTPKVSGLLRHILTYWGQFSNLLLYERTKTNGRSSNGLNNPYISISNENSAFLSTIHKCITLSITKYVPVLTLYEVCIH
jgi:hypothetical protein